MRREKVFGRNDRKVVGAVLDHCAEFSKLGGHRGDAVGLLHAPARDVGGCAWGPARRVRGPRQSSRRPDEVRVEIDSTSFAPDEASIQLAPMRCARPSSPAHARSPRHPGDLKGQRPRRAPGRHPNAPAARKYEADDASPSTSSRPGATNPSPSGISNARHPSRFTSTPKRFMRPSVSSTYGLEMSSPSTSMRARLPVHASAISVAERN